MSPAPAKPRWQLAGPYGQESWIGDPGRYEQVLLDGEPVSLNPADGELYLLRARGANCGHPGPWPFRFGFCPLCGTELREPSPARETETWSSPANGASGLPARSARGTPDPETRAELPMPGPSNLDFVVAGTPPGLLALDKTTGRLHRWVEGLASPFEGGRWQELAHLAIGAGLPRWSWGVAAFPGGAAIPGDAGPTWMALSPKREEEVPPKPQLGIRRSLGGAAAVGPAALVPVLAKGVLSVAFKPDAAEPWQCVPVPGAEADAEAAVQVFAAPSTNPSEAYWVGGRGHLFARVLAGTLTCAYRPWRGGWEPMQGVRPVLSPNGMFHQLGRLEGKQAFEALLPPAATPQRTPFDRYVISCGSASFNGMARFRDPWDPKRIEYRGDGNSFLAPLLAFEGERFVVAVCSPRAGLRRFVETSGATGDVAGGAAGGASDGQAGPALECRIAFAGASVALTDLRATVRTRAAWEIVPFIYGGSLLVYDQPANRCLRWSLAPAGPGSP